MAPSPNLFHSPILGIFDDTFIAHLFDLVEQTRDHADETFNYSIIKLIVRTLLLLTSLVSPSHIEDV